MIEAILYVIFTIHLLMRYSLTGKHCVILFATNYNYKKLIRKSFQTLSHEQYDLRRHRFLRKETFCEFTFVINRLVPYLAQIWYYSCTLYGRNMVQREKSSRPFHKNNMICAGIAFCAKKHFVNLHL